MRIDGELMFGGGVILIIMTIIISVTTYNLKEDGYRERIATQMIEKGFTPQEVVCATHASSYNCILAGKAK